MSKHMLITGINGMLGQNLVKEFSPDHQITGLDLGPSVYSDPSISVLQQDLTDLSGLEAIIQRTKPDLIIHSAAYTNVDRAEIEPDLAFAVNAAVHRAAII